MIPIVSKKLMQELDKHMIENMKIPTLLLMENAAFGITSVVEDKFSKSAHISVVCGAGNNGGDGFAAARQLLANGFSVAVYLLGNLQNLKGDAKTNADFFGTSIIEVSQTSQLDMNKADVIVDAIFGIGLSRTVEGLYAQAIETINASKAYKISCDIPSGIEADTGRILGVAVKADETVTFACAKQGHVLFPGREYSGKLTVKQIGVFGSFDIGDKKAYCSGLTLKRRKKDTHKGSYGKLACVVGSRGMAGAGIMCAKGAIKAGAGLTTLGIPYSLQDVYSTSVPECMTYALDDEQGALSYKCSMGLDKLLEGKTALATGCGLSVCSGTIKAVEYMVKSFDIKKIFDADALNIISKNPDILYEKKGEVVLTPHIGEFARLCASNITDPLKQAEEFAKKYSVTLLLKGATTIITDGTKTAFVLTGTAGMAKGGSGDVLTGLIGGLLAGDMCCFDAAMYGAYICGKAGELAAKACGEYSMAPTDTLRYICKVVKEMTM